MGTYTGLVALFIHPLVVCRICSTKDGGFRLGPVVLRSLTDEWKGGGKSLNLLDIIMRWDRL
jgi:hypothetical protein